MVLVEELPVMPVHSKPNPLMEVGYRVSTSSTISVISQIWRQQLIDDPMAHLHVPSAMLPRIIPSAHRAGRPYILGYKDPCAVTWLLTVYLVLCSSS